MNPEPKQTDIDWGFIGYEIALEAANIADPSKRASSGDKQRQSYSYDRLTELTHFPYQSFLKTILACKTGFATAVVLRPFKVNQSSGNEWTFFWGEGLTDIDSVAALAIANKAKTTDIVMSTDIIEKREGDYLKPYILQLTNFSSKVSHPEAIQFETLPESNDQTPEANGKRAMQEFAKALHASVVISIPAWTKIDDEDVKSGTIIIYGTENFPFADFWKIVTAYHSGGLMYLGAFEQQKHLVLERSYDLLMKLQRPLDALTKAFDDVQAEAQEMQAILNDPEEGLFKAHKLLAPLFQDGHEIKVSDFLSVVSYHNWSHDSDRNTHEVLQKACCYAVCSIFGMEGQLKTAQSQAALVQLARNALKEARKGGVFTELIAMVEMVFATNGKELEESILLDTLVESKNDGERFAGYLQTLKRICFTPFKEFGSKWPDAPVQLAALGSKAKANLDATERSLEPVRTPFAQHAILTFILEAKAFLKQENGSRTSRGWCPFEKVEFKGDAPLKEYRLHFIRVSETAAKCFYDPDRDKRKEGDTGELYECLRAAIRFGVVGRNVGNFHGIFQNLIRHALGVSAYPAKAGSWVLLTPAASSSVIAVFGKLMTNAAVETSLCRADCSHYFALTESVESGQRFLRIVWTEDKNDLLGTIGNGEVATVSSQAGAPQTEATAATTLETKPAPQKVPTLTPAAFYPVIVLDHVANNLTDFKGAWFKGISEIPSLKNKVTAAHEGVPSSFVAPDAQSVIVLHTGDGRGPDWKKALEGKLTVKKVIVVSTGGGPASKGIPIEGKFIHCGVKPDDLYDGAERQKLLVHLQIQEPK